MFLQRFRDDIHVRFAVAEDNRVRAFVAFRVDQRAQGLAFFGSFAVLSRAFEHQNALFDILAGGRLAGNFYALGGGQKCVGDPLDFGRHGGGEEKRLPGERGQAEDPFDIGDEAHVEHPVRFIDHHDLHAGQQQLAALEMVEKPARRGDQHVNALVDQLVLLFEGHTADQKRLGQLQVFCVGVEVFRHLCGQFACRAKHQTARHARPRAPPRQQGDHRQREAGGLAGTRLGDTQNVAAFQCWRDGACLNGGR